MTNDNTEISSQTIRFRAMILAISVGGLLMTVKFVAYFLTDSTAILSDALESIINVVASGFALYSIYVSNQPPDTSHPYGHGKIEYFSVGFEGALIILAAVAILYKAIPAFFHPRMLAQLGLGIFLLLGTSAVNLALGLFLIRTGRQTRSMPLEADGKHLLTDVYTSVGVVGGLVLVKLTGWQGWDPLAACAVARPAQQGQRRSGRRNDPSLPWRWLRGTIRLSVTLLARPSFWLFLAPEMLPSLRVICSRAENTCSFTRNCSVPILTPNLP